MGHNTMIMKTTMQIHSISISIRVHLTNTWRICAENVIEIGLLILKYAKFKLKVGAELFKQVRAFSKIRYYLPHMKYHVR